MLPMADFKAHQLHRTGRTRYVVNVVRTVPNFQNGNMKICFSLLPNINGKDRITLEHRA